MPSDSLASILEVKASVHVGHALEHGTHSGRPQMHILGERLARRRQLKAKRCPIGGGTCGQRERIPCDPSIAAARARVCVRGNTVSIATGVSVCARWHARHRERERISSASAFRPGVAVGAHNGSIDSE